MTELAVSIVRGKKNECKVLDDFFFLNEMGKKVVSSIFLQFAQNDVLESAGVQGNHRKLA